MSNCPEGFFDASKKADAKGVIENWSSHGDLSITKLWIPNTINSIGSNAFSGCTNITEVEFEDGGTQALSLGLMAFARCVSLKVITLPMRTSSIGDGCFRDCTALEKFDVPAGIRIMTSGNHIFDNCAGKGTLEAALACIVSQTVAANQAHGISMESIISGPGEVIELISQAENGCLIGHKISHVYSVGDHGSCVQIGQYFCQTEGDFLSVHFEVEAVDGRVYVEIHSELVNTPIAVHDFLYSQFRVGHDLSEKGGQKACDDGRVRRSFRFATKQINCKGRIARDVVSDIVVALDVLYEKYGAYLSYLDNYYNRHAYSLTNCSCFSEYTGSKDSTYSGSGCIHNPIGKDEK